MADLPSRVPTNVDKKFPKIDLRIPKISQKFPRFCTKHYIVLISFLALLNSLLYF